MVNAGKSKLVSLTQDYLKPLICTVEWYMWHVASSQWILAQNPFFPTPRTSVQ